MSGVLVDSELTFGVHIKRLIGWMVLLVARQLRTVHRALSVENARAFVHAFVIGRVDYCNSIYGYTNVVNLYHLQLLCILVLIRDGLTHKNGRYQVYKRTYQEQNAGDICKVDGHLFFPNIAPPGILPSIKILI